MHIITIGFHETHTRMPVHNDAHVELHYVIDGGGLFECRGVRTKVHPGHFFFVFPDESHRIIAAGDAGYIRQYIAGVAIDASEGELTRLLKRMRRKRFFQIGTNRRYLFETIRQNVNRAGYFKTSAELQLAAFLYEIAASRSASDEGDAAAAVEPALALMQSSIYGTVRLQELARASGFTREHFIRVFSKAIGYPPMKYVLMLKAEAAAGMLAGTTLPLESIAERLSFADASHLSRVFRQWKGMTPGAFRKASKTGV
ncbi:MAG: AraC family transcriptional regulator [Spirochaetes bacterium]|nr:AraC family transcriptional regulator [Spirochaetota bacterium]